MFPFSVHRLTAAKLRASNRRARLPGGDEWGRTGQVKEVEKVASTLVETSASLLVTSALLVVTRSY